MTETKRPLGVTFVTMTRIMGRSDCLSLIKELEQSSQSELIRDHQLNGEYPTSDYEEIAVFLGRSYHSRFVFRVSHKNLGYSTLTCRFELKPMCGMDPEEDYISDESVYDVKKIMTTNFHRYCRCISEALDSEDWAPTNARHIIPILAEELAITPSQYMELIQRGGLIYPSFSLQYYRPESAINIDVMPYRLEFSCQDNYCKNRYQVYTFQRDVRIPNDKGPLVHQDVLVFDLEHIFKEEFNSSYLSDFAFEANILNYYHGTIGIGDFCKLEENLRRVDQVRIYGVDPPAPGSDREVGIIASIRNDMKYVLNMVEKYGSIYALRTRPDIDSDEHERINTGLEALHMYNIIPVSLPKIWTVDVVPSPFDALRE